MEVGVKYCGGCNPRYDRPELLNKLRKAYPDVKFDYAKEGVETDLLIVLCGCTAECADISNLKAKKTVVINSIEGFEKISAVIEGNI